MATIQTRQRKDGRTAYRVVWRDPQQGVKSRTYVDEDKAVELRDFLDGNGNSFKLAAEAKRRKDSMCPTVAELVKQHIDLLRKPQDGTVAKYRRMAAAHINDSKLGWMPADRVDRQMVTEWMDSLTVHQGANQAAGGPLGRKTKMNVHSLLSAALRTELDRPGSWLTYNPAKGVSEADKNEAREPVYLSPEDLDMLVERVDEHYRLFMFLLCKTGLRYAEATALRKRDIITRNGRCVVKVTRAWKSVGRGEEIGTPKTKKARRNVTCSEDLTAALLEHMADLDPDDLVFTQPDGEYVRNSRFHKRIWQPLMTTLLDEGVLDRQPWIHEIRHAHTTHLLEAGIPVHVVQARLGHEDASTTLRVYARLSQMSDFTAADALG